MNFTDLSDYYANDIAWLNPFSNPYDVSTIFMTLAANLGSNNYDSLNFTLKSADPANTKPVTLHLSLVIKWFTHNYVTFLT